MALDGIVVKNIVEDLTSLLLGGRIEKVYQPEKDEIILHMRSLGKNLKLLLSASSNYPRIHLTEVNKENPAVPPVFCMLLRKHFTGGKLTGIVFHDYERMLELVVESIDEMGDMVSRRLIIEIMGRHSNIILVNQNNHIMDSIKRVDEEISSVRQVLPGMPYVMPPKQDKISPSEIDTDNFFNRIAASYPELSLEKLLLNNIKGFSPILCREVCSRAGLEYGVRYPLLSEVQKDDFSKSLTKVIDEIRNSDFHPFIVNDDAGKPIEFHSLHFSMYHKVSGFHTVEYDTVNQAIDLFYKSRDNVDRLKQKKSDLVKVVSSLLDRCEKKLGLQHEKLEEVSGRDQLKIYGELITSNIYCLKAGMKEAELLNFYSPEGETIVIPLEETLTPQENAQLYFKQYNKAKSAFKAVSEQLELTHVEKEYLESVLQSLESCTTVKDIEEIREELSKQGMISSKKAGMKKKNEVLSQPMHFVSSDGIDIFVGKNNRQNDALTLKTAHSADIWLHTRNIPGSHVIIRTLGKTVSEQTMLEGALLASFYSRAKMSSLVPVDYTTVRNVKKPIGAKPGMVNYFNFKTIIVTPSEEEIKKLKKIN